MTTEKDNTDCGYVLTINLKTGASSHREVPVSEMCNAPGNKRNWRYTPVSRLPSQPKS